jgi:hypothetical protein
MLDIESIDSTHLLPRRWVHLVWKAKASAVAGLPTMKKQTSAPAVRIRSRFCFVTLTVDCRRFDSVELATEAGKRQLRGLLDFMREKKAEIHRSILDEAATVKHWQVLFSCEKPITAYDIESFWGLGRVNVVNWIQPASIVKYLLKDDSGK